MVNDALNVIAVDHANALRRILLIQLLYQKANTDFDKWLTDNGYPTSSHAGIEDTSEMLYLGGNDGWVRKELIATAVGAPRPKPGEPRDPDAPRVNNGISGDARRSTPELGKRFLDLKVEYAAKQIQELLSAPAASK